MLKIKKVSVHERRFNHRDNNTRRSHREYFEPTRVYVFPETYTVMENLVNRCNRPHNAWKPIVLKELQDAGFDVARLQWSQNAGCKMCPCSPGFIVHLKDSDRAIKDPCTNKPIDIYINLKEEVSQ